MTGKAELQLDLTGYADTPVLKAVAKTNAQDFVMVEPSYSPKKVDNPARAVDAASKFVERPEGNLLPSPNAAMQARTAWSSSATGASTPAQRLSTLEALRSFPAPGL